MQVSCDDVEIAGHFPAEDVNLFKSALITPDGFLNAIRDGAPDFCLPTAVAIPQFPSIWRSIGEVFKAKGVPTTDIVDKRWLNLRAICPDCTCILTGDSLGTLYMMSVDGWEHYTIWGPGRAFRWVKGTCANEQCTAKQTILVWFPLHELIQKGEDIATLAELLEEGHYWFARKKLVQRLSSIQSGRSLQSLIRAVHDKHADVRLVAVQGLGNFYDALAVETLIQVVDSEEDETVKQAATESLSEIRRPQ